MADVTSSSEYVQYTSSSSNQYDNSNQYASSSSVDNYNYNQYTTSSLEYNNQYTTSTLSAYVAANTVSYGSGSSNWVNSGYNDCVQRKF